MLYRIIDLIIKHDTFGLFVSTEPISIKTIIDKIPNFLTFEQLKIELINFFKSFLNDDRSIYYNESLRMLKFINKIFYEAEKNKTYFDCENYLVKMYSESLTNFVEGNEKLKKHVDFILQ
ncbi:hypothetical protein DMUE_2941 [Dictyocoela muelleri]|nr:hypothetical protein DMUE_2941 [Dictyocoela muelleri]